MQGLLGASAFRHVRSWLLGAWTMVVVVFVTTAPAHAGCRMVGIWNKFQVCTGSGSSGGGGTAQVPRPPPIPKPKDPALLQVEAADQARKAGDLALAVERFERAYAALDKFRHPALHQRILDALSALYVDLANRAIRRGDYVAVRGYLRNAANWAWYLDANFHDRSWLAEAGRLQRWLDERERLQAAEAQGRERLDALNRGLELLDGGQLGEAVRHLAEQARVWPGDDAIRGLLLQAQLALDARRGAALAADRALHAERDAATRDRVRRDLVDLMASLTGAGDAAKGSALDELITSAPPSAPSSAAPAAGPADTSVVDLRDLGGPGRPGADPHRMKLAVPPGVVPMPVAALPASLPPTTDQQARRRNNAVLNAIEEGQRRPAATGLDWAATLAYLREARRQYPDDLAVRDAAVMLLAVAAIGAAGPEDRHGLLPPVTAADLPDYETWSLLVRAEHHRYAGAARYLGDRNGWSLVRRELEVARALYNQAHERNPGSLALRDLVNDTDGLIIYFIGLERGP